MGTARFGSTAPKAAKVNTLLFSINPFYQQGLKRLGTAGRLQTTWDEGVGGVSGDTRLRAGALPGGGAAEPPRALPGVCAVGRTGGQWTPATSSNFPS